MFCPNCGRQLPDTAKFCPRCGAQVSNRQPVKQSAAPQPVATVQGATQPVQPVAHAAAGTTAGKKKSGISSTALGIIVGIATAVVILLGVLIFMYTQDLLPFGGGPDRQQSGDKAGEDDGRPSGKDDHSQEGSGGQESGGGLPSQPDAPYPDSVDLAALVADPASYVGRHICVNAAVSGVCLQNVQADIVSGDGDVLPVNLAFESDAVHGSPNRDDTLYIDGDLAVQGEDFYYFTGASVTFTGGVFEGLMCESSGSIPWGVPLPVTDYGKFAGTFATAGDADAFLATGGPLAVLNVTPTEIAYTVTNYNAATGDAAQISGAAPADGSPAITYYGDDGWGNTVECQLSLLSSGTLLFSASGTADSAYVWDLDQGFARLIPCSGYVPQLYEPRTDHTQELIVSSRGSSATLTLRNWDRGAWADLFTASAYLGSNGISYNKTEGDKCTPAGTFDILFAFGTVSRTLNIDYYRIKAGDVWVDDVNSYYYNTMQTTSTPGKDWKSAEDLYAKFTNNRSTACIYFNYNGDGLSGGSAYYKGGSDLFIDGLGSASTMGPGYGDIRISSADMETLLSLLDSDRNPKLIIS